MNKITIFCFVPKTRLFLWLIYLSLPNVNNNYNNNPLNIRSCQLQYFNLLCYYYYLL